MVLRTPKKGALRVGTIDVGLAALAFTIDTSLWTGTQHTRLALLLPPAVGPVVSGIAALLLVVRRRLPLVCFTVTVVGGLVPLAVPSHEPFVALVVSLYTVARRCRTDVAVAAVVVGLIPAGVNAWDTVYLNGSRDPLGFVAVGTLWALIVVVSWAVGRMRFLAARRAADQEIEHERRAAAAIRDERAQLARELHDIVSSSVSAMTLQAALVRLRSLASPQNLEDGLLGIEETGEQAMRELHRLLHVLRASATPAVEEGPAETPGLKGLDRLIRTVEACGVTVRLRSLGQEQSLDASVEKVAYRFFQESLTNVLKHGPAAATVLVLVEWQPLALRLSVQNPVRNAPPQQSTGPGGLGLLGLSERIQLVGGSVTANASPERFELSAYLPLPGDATAKLASQNVPPASLTGHAA